jgi:23S rRNA (cytosine1962-C5)-methyltransferase
MLLLSPENFADYELIDCGDFERLERFGNYVVIRPEPQAVWNKKLSDKEWEKQAHARYTPKSASSGIWQKMKRMPDQWTLKYRFPEINKRPKKEIAFRLHLSNSKDLGVLPEQAVSWDFIYKTLIEFQERNQRRPGRRGPSDIRVLNLFAYTGLASLAARATGAEVTHLDSIKQVITLARENMDLSEQKDIRWVIEDAMAFVKREIKRGKRYHGVLLDPPAYGHGPKGESWKLENQINEMIRLVLKLCEENYFLVLSSATQGFSALMIENVFKCHTYDPLQIGEMYLRSKTDQKLPSGVFGRILKP